MNYRTGIPVEIKPVKDPEGKIKIKATLPVSILLNKDFNPKTFEKELVKIEEKYLNLTAYLKNIINRICLQKRKPGKVLLYWELGDKVSEFFEFNNSNNILINNLIKSLARDTGISEKIISRCRRFRLKFPDQSKIDPARSFYSYIAIFEKGYLSRKK